ncbi:hypothetical protein V499_03326 [Pseudogymnoascus sp. VKM F-103]|nr:hypothetical protein V499_03326 [Pseudogymnoascus sp. VKM F-103]
MDCDIPDDFMPWWNIEVPDASNSVIYEGQQSGQLHFAPYMERDDSGSSFNSYSSNNTTDTFESLDSNSSFSSYGSFTSQTPPHTTSGGYSLHQGYSPVHSVTGSANLYNFPLPSFQDQVMSKPLFDIERDGDPNISWWMYYDFHVDKEGAYHTLQPGYLESEKFPARRLSDKVYDEKGNLVHKCYVPKCTSKPVKRPFDLERHFTTVHGKGNSERQFCDYSKCKHKEAFDRKDHCREHYREYHREDLVKKTHRDVVQWLQDRNVVMGWWRCSKCLKRNQTEAGWKCGGKCNQMCERSRITARNSRLQAAELTEVAEQPAAAGASQPFVQGCGNCESGWFPDEANPHNWVACLVCKPEASEEMITW